MLHPAAILALAVLAANDQLLKPLAPGFVTGKLSDVTGLIVAPLALVAAWEIWQWRTGRWHGPTMRVLAVACGVVAVGFVALELWAPAADLYRVGLGTLQWPFRAVIAALRGLPATGIHPVVAVADAEDLLALPALAVTMWLGRARVRRVTRRAGQDARASASGGMP